MTFAICLNFIGLFLFEILFINMHFKFEVRFPFFYKYFSIRNVNSSIIYNLIYFQVTKFYIIEQS